eukprot:5306009-Pyramimonas_sp.AAC.1
MENNDAEPQITNSQVHSAWVPENHCGQSRTALGATSAPRPKRTTATSSSWTPAVPREASPPIALVMKDNQKKITDEDNTFPPTCSATTSSPPALPL